MEDYELAFEGVDCLQGLAQEEVRGFVSAEFYAQLADICDVLFVVLLLVVGDYGAYVGWFHYF